MFYLFVFCFVNCVVLASLLSCFVSFSFHKGNLYCSWFVFASSFVLLLSLVLLFFSFIFVLFDLAKSRILIVYLRPRQWPPFFRTKSLITALEQGHHWLGASVTGQFVKFLII